MNAGDLLVIHTIGVTLYESNLNRLPNKDIDFLDKDDLVVVVETFHDAEFELGWIKVLTGKGVGWVISSSKNPHLNARFMQVDAQ